MGPPVPVGGPDFSLLNFNFIGYFFLLLLSFFFFLKLSQSVNQSIGHKQQPSLALSSSHKHQAYQHQLSPSEPHCTPLFCTPLSILAFTEHFNHFPLPTTIAATSSSFLGDILRRLMSVISLKHNSVHRTDELPLGALGSCRSSVHSEMK